MIKRTDTLNFLFKTFKDIKTPKIVELIGDAGIGKSTLISQIAPHFFENNLDINLVQIKSSNTPQLFSILVKAISQNNINVPKSLIESKPITKEDSLRLSLELIYAVREKEELILFIFDDFHLLSYEIQEEVKLLFSKIYLKGNFGSLHLARPNYKSDNAHIISGFSKKEFIEYIEFEISTEWLQINEKVCNWIYTLTDGNPFLISLFIQQLLKSGLVNNYEITISELKSLNIPDKIFDLIRLKFENIPNNSQLLTYLQKFALLNSSLNKADIDTINIPHNFLKLAINKEILSLKNGNYDFYHPTVKEFILTTLNDNEKDEILNSLLESIGENNQIKYFNLIKQLSKKTDKQINEILEYSEILREANQNYLAIDLLKSVQNYMDNPKIILNLGINWDNMSNYENSGKYFNIILNHPKYSKDRFFISETVHYLVLKNKTDQALDIINYCLKKPNEIRSKTFYYLLLVKIWILVRCYDWTQIQDTLLILEKFSIKNIYAKLNYYNALLKIPSIYPHKIDKKKLYKDSINYALKVNEKDYAAQFSHTIMCDFIKNKNKKYAEKYYLKTKQISQECFSIQVDKSADKFYASHLILQHKYFEGLQILKKHNSAFDIQFFLNPISLTKLKIDLFNVLGKNQYLEYLGRHLLETKDLTAMGFIENFQALGYHFLCTNQIQTAITFIIKGNGLVKNIKLKQDYNYFDIMNLILIEDKEVFNRQLKNLWKNKKEKVYFSNLSFVLSLKIMSYLKNDEPLNEEYFDFKSNTKIQLFGEMIFAVNSFRIGKMNEGLTLIAKLENNFDGQYIIYYYRMYAEICKYNHLPNEIIAKFENISSKLNYIINYSPQNKKPLLKKENNGFGFEYLIQIWYKSLVKNKEIQESNLELFTNDIDKIEQLKTLFSLWNIKVVNTPKRQQQITLYTDMLGEYKVYKKGVQGEILHIKNLTKSQQFMIFFIILNNSNVKKMSIQKFIHEFFPNDDFKNALNKVNVYISRINSQFKNLNIKLFSIKNGFIYLNKNINLVADTEKMINLMKIGEENCVQNKWDLARINYEVCFHLYRGELLPQIESNWIDSLRSFYVDKYIQIVDSLIAVYEELELDNLKIELLQKAMILHPHLEEFQEYFEETKHC